jgi:hypothetical protein
MTIARGILLLLVTGFLGALSSFFWLIPNGLMAAALAMSLSCGTIWLSRNQAKTLRPPEKRQVVAVGLITGLVGGGVAILLQWLFPYLRGRGEIDLGAPPTPEWALLLSAVLYGLVLHGSYYRRIRAESPLKRALLSAAIGCMIIRSGVGAIYLQAAAVLLAIFGALPFALMWVWATYAIDPYGELPVGNGGREDHSLFHKSVSENGPPGERTLPSTAKKVEGKT